MRPSQSRYIGPDRRSSKGECGENGLRIPVRKESKEDPNKKAKRLAGPVIVTKATAEELEKYFGKGDKA